MINIKKTDDNIITLTMDVRERPKNVITDAFLSTLETIVEEIGKDETTKGVILTSSQHDFMVGADLEMIQSLKETKKIFRLTRRLQTILRELEQSGKPVVAAINGSALGGGFELALSAHHRICLNEKNIRIGLPEVKLGLLPGGGGTQKLPRILGFKKALPILMEGKTYCPEKALELGLIHDLAENAEEMLQKAFSFIEENPEIKMPWDEKKFRIPGGEVQSPEGYQVFPAATAMLYSKARGNYPAPENILKSVYEGLQVNIDKGLEIEASYFTQLVQSQESKNMIRTLFYGINCCNKGAARPLDIPPREVKRVGVLGGGLMGTGIAHAIAKAGIEVILKDISMEKANESKDGVSRILAKEVERGLITFEEKEEILGLIKATDNPQQVEGSELVIEAVIEDRKIKAMVTKESEAVIEKDGIFASNTSTLPISSLASESSRPKNFIGLHFFSPVQRMPLVEIIMGDKTSDETLAFAMDFVKKIKKTPIVVRDGRGFYTSRVFITYITEGIIALTEGINPALIERAGVTCGMPLGPLGIADEVGLDLVHHILEQTVKDLGEGAVHKDVYKFIQKIVLEEKRLGKKNRRGFYDYPAEQKKCLWPELYNQFPKTEDGPSLEDLMQRFLGIQSLESIRCLDEGILDSTRDGDVGSILGWGFPAFTGGSFAYVDMIGIKPFYEKCLDWEKELGPRFSPPKLLKDMTKDSEASFHTH